MGSGMLDRLKYLQRSALETETLQKGLKDINCQVLIKFQ